MTTASLMGADGNLLDCTGIQCLDLHVQECVVWESLSETHTCQTVSLR